MKESPAPAGPANSPNLKHPLLWVVLLLVIIFAILFRESFLPGYVIFSNDGPYGGEMAQHNRMPAVITGVWADLNWLGNESLTPPASLSSALRLVTTPMVYGKILCPFALLIAGLGACFCFRQLKLAPWACVLGGLAAALNSDFFSTSCWGVSSQIIGFGAMYVAVGFLGRPTARLQWIRVILAGMAVGVGVMEAYDIGALFSLFVALFVVCQSLFLTEEKGDVPLKIGRGAWRVALVAVFAALIATNTLTGLIGTQIQGISGAQQDEAVKKMRWEEKTQWSVPKAEILQVIIPGIFGYRNNWHMYEDDQPKEDQYWGTIGEGQGMFRLIGTGFYAGVPVVLLALWAILQSFRRRGSPFSLFQRRAIWFWSAVMVVAALLSFGKHAMFYQFFYALPYASTIRNPAKFMHICSWALVIVFAYGAHGLVTAYMTSPIARVQGLLAQFNNWRAKADPFERKWITGCLAAIGVSVLAWGLYAAQSAKLEAYLPTVGIPGEEAQGIARFSVHSVGWFILFLVLAAGLLAAIFSGQFNGPRARWGGILLGALILVDLGRADAPWIVYWDTNYKYANDDIIKFLSDKPYEHRVTLLPIPASSDQTRILQNAYYGNWKQHLFQEHNIQCIDVVQEPRVALDKEAFMRALPANSTFNLFRYWELTNTKYILGPGGAFINQLDPSGKLFRIVKSFDFKPKKPNPSTWSLDYSAVDDPNGQLAVIEFLGALPRARLYSEWQISTNDDRTLQTLASQAFDPHRTVLVSNSIIATPATNTNQSAGTVEIKPNYKSKRVELTADVKTRSVLLLADRYNPKWQVDVDGKPAELLRCNFIMQGVFLQPGSHDIVFRYVSPTRTLWISVATIVFGLILWGFLKLKGSGNSTPPDSPIPEEKEKAGK